MFFKFYEDMDDFNIDELKENLQQYSKSFSINAPLLTQNFMPA